VYLNTETDRQTGKQTVLSLAIILM